MSKAETEETTEVTDETEEETTTEEGQEVTAAAAEETEETTEEEGTKEEKEEGKVAAKAKKPELVDRRELTKVITERQDAKKKLREKEQELAELKRANEGESERVQREAREAATAEIESKYKPLVVRTTARAELLDAGAPKDTVDQMIADFIRVEDVEVDENGNVTGVDAQVLAAKEKYPMLFPGNAAEQPVKKPRVTAKVADGADKPAAKKKLSAEERAMRMLQGKPA
jgi:hypothetical protein